MTRAAIRILGAWMSLHAATVPADTAPPVEAFAQRPAIIDVDLNPSGTRLAWIEDTGKGARVVIHDLTTRRDMRTIGAPASITLHTIYWANDETALLYESATQPTFVGSKETAEWYRWVALDASGGENRLLLMGGGERQWVTSADLVRRYTAKPGKVFMSTLDWSATHYREEIGSRLRGGRKDEGWISNLYEVDLKTGSGKVIEAGTPFTLDWLTDESATHIVRSEWNPQGDSFGILVKSSGGWKDLYRSKGCGRVQLLAFTRDAAGVIVHGQTCGAPDERAFALALDGSGERPLLADSTAAIAGVIRDPFDQAVIAVTLDDEHESVRWLDPVAERRAAGFRKTFAGSSTDLLGRSANGRRIVVRTRGEASPPVYYFIDYDAKTADIINEAYPRLADVKLGSITEFRYDARDKYPLLAYLTLPPAGGERNLPLVVLPHGGPEDRDYKQFDWLAQFIASRGYAVLQPQFRGSSGFGRAHADAGRHQWGLRMQDDVTDAVRAATERGIADPKRVCIVGASYGGYAALAGAAFTPELYACAVSIAGLSNLPEFLAFAQKSGWGKESNEVAYWKDHIGSASDPNVISRSPVRGVASIRAPILLMHGTDDTIVPISQSRAMAKALEATGKPYEFVELPGDDHNLSASVTRVQMAKELERFLGRHLTGPSGATAPGT